MIESESQSSDEDSTSSLLYYDSNDQFFNTTQINTNLNNDVANCSTSSQSLQISPHFMSTGNRDLVISGDDEPSEQWMDCVELNDEPSGRLTGGQTGGQSDTSVDDTEKRFQQLMKLLNKSKFYSQVLSKKLVTNRKKLREEEENRNKANKRFDTNVSSQENKRYNTRSDSKTGDNNRQILTQVNNKDGQESSCSRSVRTKYKRKAAILCNEEISNLLNDDSSDDSFDSYSSSFAHKSRPKQRILDGIPISVRQPFLLSGTHMRDYQLDGLDWLKILQENNMNGILADEMGLGKTIQCVALIAHIIESCSHSGPFLVVAPLSTLHNWEYEFERFAPLIQTLLFYGEKKERQHLRYEISVKHNVYVNDKRIKYLPVVITSYETVKREINCLKKYQWTYVIIDEGHRIKNYGCQLAKLMRQINSENRLLLTGTPIHNSLAELWALLNYISDVIFDDLEIFESWFALSSSDEQIIQQELEKKIITTMHQILSPFMLRRTKSEVGLNLPPKKEILVYAPSSSAQRLLYESAIELVNKGKLKTDNYSVDLSEGRKRRKCVKNINYAELLDSDLDDDSSNSSLLLDESKMKIPEELISDATTPQFVSFGRFTKNNILMQMRKICNHPYLIQWPLSKNGLLLVNEDLIQCSGKMRVLDELLTQLYSRNHRVVLFSQMTKMLDIIEEYCIYKKYKYRVLDGSTRLNERKKYIKEFNSNNNSDIFIFLISTRAGGLGINLTGADTVIIYDSDWNPQMDLQAQDRCHRIGQTKPVIVYRLVTANTVDESIVKRANAKRKLDKMIIQRGQYFRMSDDHERPHSMTLQELLNLLKSTDFNAIYNYSKQNDSSNSLFSDEDIAKLMDRSSMGTESKAENAIIGDVKENNDESIVEIRAPIIISLYNPSH